tara:strand:- start:904 stop:1515 length:612 start_codon:yes stop_codon:yes gene_type:complete
MSLESIKKNPKYLKAVDSGEQEFIKSLSYKEKKEFLSLPDDERESFRDSLGQGMIDSLADNFLIRATIYIGLVKEMNLTNNGEKDHNEKNILFQKIINILISENDDYEIIQPDLDDLNDLYDNFSNELLENYCSSFADAYTPGGESYNVLVSEMGATLNEVEKMKNATHHQIEKGLFLLNNTASIEKDKFENYILKVFEFSNF